MTTLFDSAVFDSAIFDTGAAVAAEQPRASGGLGRVPSRVQAIARPDDPRDLSALIRAGITFEVEAEGRGAIEHAAQIVLAQKPTAQKRTARVKPPWRIQAAGALRAEASAMAVVNHVCRASGVARFSFMAEGCATAALEPELVSPDVLLALLVALDDQEMAEA